MVEASSSEIIRAEFAETPHTTQKPGAGALRAGAKRRVQSPGESQFHSVRRSVGRSRNEPIRRHRTSRPWRSW